MHEQFSSPEVNTREQELEEALILTRHEVERLKKANDELVRLNQQKIEFVSLATHQIRGPLGAIRGYISLLLEGDFGALPAAVIEPLNITLKSTETLGKTVNDFLDVSRLDQGEMRYYRKDFDFTHLVQEVINEMKKSIEDAGLELRLNIPADILMIHGDKAKLKHVLHNLIDNSCKYTKNGWVEIDLNKIESNKVIFCIKDSGVGIKPETMPKLFQKFSRDTDADKTNILGTGLGLYVARKMLEAQHGRIWAESEGEGKGSRFYVELELLA
jgi:signal transduction histidine kinase